MNSSSGMPGAVLAALVKEAGASAKSASGDELLFAELEVLDQVKKALPKLRREILLELRDNPANTLQAIANRLGTSAAAIEAAINPRKTVASPAAKLEGLSVTEAANALGAAVNAINARIKGDPDAEWFVKIPTPGMKRDSVTRIVDLDALRALLPDGLPGYSFTEVAEQLGIERAVVKECARRNPDAPWLYRDQLPGKKRSDLRITDIAEFKKALAAASLLH